jgi:hypothetical protein
MLLQLAAKTLEQRIGRQHDLGAVLVPDDLVLAGAEDAALQLPITWLPWLPWSKRRWARAR